MSNNFYEWIPDYTSGTTNIPSYTQIVESGNDRQLGFRGGQVARSSFVNMALRQANLVTVALMNIIIPDSNKGYLSSLSDIQTEIQNFVNALNVVGTSKISDSAVITAKIANGAVVTVKIADTAVTKAKLNSDITSGEFANMRVGYATESGHSSTADSATNATNATNTAFTNEEWTRIDITAQQSSFLPPENDTRLYFIRYKYQWGGTNQFVYGDFGVVYIPSSYEYSDIWSKGSCIWINNSNRIIYLRNTSGSRIYLQDQDNGQISSNITLWIKAIH